MHALLAIALAISSAAPGAPTPRDGGALPDGVLLEGMGTWTRPACADAQAQRFFDQGLTLVFAFQHDEAVRSFEHAAALEPACAMAWWGAAIARGPHINHPEVPPEAAAAARDALARAQPTRDVERALVEAARARFAPSPAGGELAYVAAMRAVRARWPADADVAVLWADAVLTLNPWKTWTKSGKPEKHTLDVVAVLQRVLEAHPSHPGANHLLVHALEASPFPERAAASADRLRTLVPGAGHLVHMAAHIDVRTGRWHDAILANEAAVRADDAYRKVRPEPGFYGFYMAHNPHFLAYAAMMDGQYARAIAAARAMRAKLPPGFVEANAEAVDGYLALPVEVLVRFGKWDEILREPEPDGRLRVSRALRHHARGVAFAVKGDVAAAQKELAALREEQRHVGDRPVGLNTGKDVVAIAEKLLEGELFVVQGDIVKGVRALERAVAIEDGLRYDEPPPWTLPARHALGAALLHAKKGPQAERVFRADLLKNRENGWALTGLARALRLQGREQEATAVDARVQAAFARADGASTSSCHCLP